MPRPWPSPEEAVLLPVDELAMRVLWRFVYEHSAQFNRTNLVVREADSADSGSRHAVEIAYAEAWDWLSTHNLISRDPGSETWSFVTRRGHEVAAATDGLRALHAGERLAVALHSRIEAAIGSEWVLGRFEMASFAAMRAVEIRVRELAVAGASDIGVPLMQHAFGEAGPLANAEADPGERQATMALFWGAIGVFKNPSSHRQVDVDDPTEASEIVLLADLLMRMLDRLE